MIMDDADTYVVRKKTNEGFQKIMLHIERVKRPHDKKITIYKNVLEHC
jgi:hypothetical protein